MEILDFLFIAVLITVVFLTWISILSFMRREDPYASTGGYIYTGIFLISGWIMAGYAIVERFKTGKYPLAVFRFFGIDITN